jgi:hypothetical protein
VEPSLQRAHGLSPAHPTPNSFLATDGREMKQHNRLLLVEQAFSVS